MNAKLGSGARPYTISELMISRLAAEIKDRHVIHVGAYTPLVLAASLLAKATHAPNAVLFPISVSGIVADRAYPLTVTMWEAMSMSNGLAYRVIELFNHVEGDHGFDIEPIAPAQIDRFGNVNNSVIGSYDRPKVRLPGAAGIDNLPICKRTPLILYSMHHTTRTFVEKVDFITGTGFLGGPGDREREGIIGRGGPRIVVTNLAVLDFDETTKRMRLVTLHEGVTLADVKANTGFEVLVPGRVGTTPPPKAEELAVLREAVDPLGIRDLEFLSAKERSARVLELLDREVELYAR